MIGPIVTTQLSKAVILSNGSEKFVSCSLPVSRVSAGRPFPSHAKAVAKTCLSQSLRKMRVGTGLTFTTLHVVGSNNGLGQSPKGDAEYSERNSADLAWLKQAFQHAKIEKRRRQRHAQTKP